MFILKEKIKLIELQPLAEKMFGNLIKGVVDIEREIVAVDGELHSDLAEMLVADGSRGENLWGFNIYPAMVDANWLEFDSMINVKPLKNNRSRVIENLVAREKAEITIKMWVITQ